MSIPSMRLGNFPLTHHHRPATTQNASARPYLQQDITLFESHLYCRHSMLLVYYPVKVSSPEKTPTSSPLRTRIGVASNPSHRPSVHPPAACPMSSSRPATGFPFYMFQDEPRVGRHQHRPPGEKISLSSSLIFYLEVEDCKKLSRSLGVL